MARIRIQSEAGRRQSRAALHRALSAAHRLADLVCCDGIAGRIPVAVALRLEPLAKRPRHTVAAGERSIPERSAAFRSCAALHLSVCADRRTGMVASRTDWRMVAAALPRQRELSPDDGGDALARLICS